MEITNHGLQIKKIPHHSRYKIHESRLNFFCIPESRAQFLPNPGSRRTPSRPCFNSANNYILDEAEYDMKNYADRGRGYPPKPEVDNALQDLHNSSYNTKAEFNNCFIIYSKYFQSFKEDKIYFV